MANCNTCKHKTIIKAYRTICDLCIKGPNGEKHCTKCNRDVNPTGFAVHSNKIADKAAKMKLEQEMDEVMSMLRVRCRRTVIRKIESEEVTYDKVRKMFVYKETQEEYKVEHIGDNDSSDSDDDHKAEPKAKIEPRPKPEGASDDEDESDEEASDDEEEKLESIPEVEKKE